MVVLAAVRREATATDQDRHVVFMGKRVDLYETATELMKTPNYLTAMKELGFQVVEETAVLRDEGKRSEKHFVLMHPHGILLSFETQQSEGEVKPGGNFYFNWKPNDIHDLGDTRLVRRSLGTSISTEGGVVWAGHHECHEHYVPGDATNYAGVHKLVKLAEKGTFVMPWVAYPPRFAPWPEGKDPVSLRIGELIPKAPFLAVPDLVELKDATFPPPPVL